MGGLSSSLYSTKTTPTKLTPSSCPHFPRPFYFLLLCLSLTDSRRIPYVTTPSGRRLQDWDCADAIDLPLLESTLRHVHRHGALPPELYSKEDSNSVGESGISDAEVQAHRKGVVTWLNTSDLPQSVRSITICILDGFLLYSNPEKRSIPRSITDALDLKLFIRSDYARTKARREARKGYVTLEGFWEDPEGYVDEVVWPNYVEEHKWMFKDGNVDEGDLERSVREEGILVAPGKGEMSMGELLSWCVGTVESDIASILGKSNR
jgi:nicotinamide/nicotinate riboside kinase